MRSSPNISLILDGTSQSFTCCTVKLLRRDWHWWPVITKKKNWPWGARWNSLPVALCDEGCFAAPNCFTAETRCFAAVPAYPAWDPLQDPCLTAFLVLCSTCFAAVHPHALQHDALQHRMGALQHSHHRWRPSSWSPRFLNSSRLKYLPPSACSPCSGRMPCSSHVILLTRNTLIQKYLQAQANY